MLVTVLTTNGTETLHFPEDTSESIIASEVASKFGEDATYDIECD